MSINVSLLSTRICIFVSIEKLRWFSLNIFYLLKCTKKTRHKLNKPMKFSPKYNKLQHYLIEHVYMYMNISYMNKCTLNKNREWREEWERGWWGWCEGLFSWWTTDNKKPFKPLYIFKHVLKIIPFCLATLIVTNVRDLKTTSSWHKNNVFYLSPSVQCSNQSNND